MTLEYKETFYDAVEQAIRDAIYGCDEDEKSQFFSVITNKDSLAYKRLYDMMIEKFSTIIVLAELNKAILDAVFIISSTEFPIYDGSCGITEEELAKHGLEVVVWADSQLLFGFPNWTKHCSLINDEKGLDLYGSSAYVVETAWLKSVTK